MNKKMRRGRSTDGGMRTPLDVSEAIREANRQIRQREREQRYIVRGTDWAQDEPDPISRPEVFDTETGESIGGRWALNDWDHAERFAAELNKETEQR